MCVNFSVAKKLLLIKKVMSEELIYIVNGKKSNGNKRKNLLGKNERIGLRKKWLKQGHRIDNADHYYFWDQFYSTL